MLHFLIGIAIFGLGLAFLAWAIIDSLNREETCTECDQLTNLFAFNDEGWKVCMDCFERAGCHRG